MSDTPKAPEPISGGSYARDPETGALTPIEQPNNEPQAAAAAPSTDTAAAPAGAGGNQE